MYMENKDVIQIKNIRFKYDKEYVLDDLTIAIKEKKITTFLGANGCGKTTLLYLLSKHMTPNEGEMYLNERGYSEYGRKEFAKKIAIVHQQNTAPDDISVEDLVGYGRIPHRGLQSNNSKEDLEKIEWALQVSDLLSLKKRRFSELSGGQKQRVWIAMALAQDTEIILFDEPTTYLDIHYQIEVLKLIKELNETYKKTIIMILHDINQAVHYSDEIILFEKDSNKIHQGTPESVINDVNLESAFQKKLALFEHEGRKVVLTV